MTRKHFTAIAMMLRHHALSGHYTSMGNFAEVVSEWADMLAETNPNFDRERFTAACVEGTPVSGDAL